MAAATREPLVHPGAPVADMLAGSLRLSAGHSDRASSGLSRFDRACDCLRRVCGLGSRRESVPNLPNLNSFGQSSSDVASLNSTRSLSGAVGSFRTTTFLGDPGAASSEVLTARAPGAGPTAEFDWTKGEMIDVWSNSQKKWFCDGLVVDVVHEDRVVNDYRVPAQSIKVGFDSQKSFKWLGLAQCATEIRRPPYRWTSVAKDQTLPKSFAEDSANAATCIMWDGESVCGLDAGRDPGRRTAPGDVRALRLGAGFAAGWRPVRAGDPPPDGAVRVDRDASAGLFCVARAGQRKEVCTLVLSSDGGKETVQAVVLPDGTDAKAGEALVVLRAGH